MPRAPKPAPSAPKLVTYAALLRGVNVGGKNIVPMRALAALFEAAGCTSVSTYIQSGNVVFKAAPRVADGLAPILRREIAAEFGCEVPVVLRTAADLGTVAKRNPFLARGASPDALHVMFLADMPTAAALAALDARRSPPDEFIVQDREIYLSCPNGVARTKLTNAYFDTKLATTSTGRNWRTVEKLVSLTLG